MRSSREQHAFNQNKFQELILYIADRSAEDRLFGATKLNKILFFSDFLAYKRLGKPITGATYQKLHHGPAPKEYLPTLKRLQDSRAAVIREGEHFGRTQKRLIALREPNLGLFTAEEIALVEDVIDALSRRNAAEVSALSHALSVGWRIARLKEEIPYETVFLSREPLTDEDIRRGQELAAEHGWLASTQA